MASQSQNQAGNLQNLNNFLNPQQSQFEFCAEYLAAADANGFSEKEAKQIDADLWHGSANDLLQGGLADALRVAAEKFSQAAALDSQAAGRRADAAKSLEYAVSLRDALKKLT